MEATFFTAPPKVPPREEEGRAIGHGKNAIHQGVDPGSSAPGSTLVKGENQIHKLFTAHNDIPEASGKHNHMFGHSYNQYEPREYKLPKIDFPKFYGEHPQVWREKCEKYFSMFHFPVHVWVPFATINFKGNAELWLQTYEAKHSIDSWPELCVAVEQKFGRDLQHNYMKDLLTIRQTSDVLEYAARFEQAKHRVLVHNKDMGDVFFVQKFLNGLKYQISNAITLHKPRIVDDALSLAIMQEEILEASSKRFQPRAREYSRSAVKTTSMPSSRNSATPGVLGPLPGNDKPPAEQPQKPRWDEKMTTLRAARKAKGLCMRCGEIYGPQHRCPKQIRLHVLEEVLEACQLHNSDTASETRTQDGEEELLCLSYCATEGIQGKKTIRLQGRINNTDILLLVDSGSSSTFVTERCNNSNWLYIKSSL